MFSVPWFVCSPKPILSSFRVFSHPWKLGWLVICFGVLAALAGGAFNPGFAQTAAHFGGVQSTVGTALSECFGVAVDGNGNVYIADTYHNQVLRETPSGGTYTQTVVDTALNTPYGVAVDESGNVYVADTYNSRIVKETLSAGSYTPSV